MIRLSLVGALAVAFVTPAVAHVTLESQEAKVGGAYKAVLRVPHGCERQRHHLDPRQDSRGARLA